MNTSQPASKRRPPGCEQTVNRLELAIARHGHFTGHGVKGATGLPGCGHELVLCAPPSPPSSCACCERCPCPSHICV
eukprot:scaffold18200_cov104-Isochrysis_galbana.AAC.2